jgi:hypothetical protein
MEAIRAHYLERFVKFVFSIQLADAVITMGYEPVP